MKYRYAKMFALAALAFGVTTIGAEAANCQGRRDTGTAVGAVGGGIAGNAASRGSVGGTIAGALLGGVAGNIIGSSNCGHRDYRDYSRNDQHRHYDQRRVAAFYYDRSGHRHYYR